jgi:putative PIN family toxin of toxin-antitoxin system
MNRVVLDTNVIVSALLVPAGTQASVLLLALQGRVALYISSPVIDEYEEVLRRPRLKLQPRQIQEALAAIREVAHLVARTQTLSISTHESDNRFLECAEAARADYLVTGNTRHFPQSHKTTKIVTGRQFLDILGESERK